MSASLIGFGLSCFEQFELTKVHCSTSDIVPINFPNLPNSSDEFNPGKSNKIAIIKPESLPLRSVTANIVWDAIFIRIELSNGTVISMASNKWAKQLINHSNNDIVNIWEISEGLLIRHKSSTTLLRNDANKLPSINLDVNIEYFCTLTNGKSYALLTDGTLQLCTSLNPYNANMVFSKPLIKQVANGTDHVILLTSNGYVYSFGIGSRGQLGHGDLSPRDCPIIVEALGGIRVISISSGNWHSMALTEHGDIYSWGMNDKGQLGHSIDNTIHPIPTLVTMAGDNAHFVSISCGSRHSSAQTNDNVLHTWGWSEHGQVIKDKITGVQYSTCGAWSTVLIRYDKSS